MMKKLLIFLKASSLVFLFFAYSNLKAQKTLEEKNNFFKVEDGQDYKNIVTKIQFKANNFFTVEEAPGSINGEYRKSQYDAVHLASTSKGEKTLKYLNNNTKVSLSGVLKKWHKITLTFDGPLTSETDEFNPFMNYRLNVTLTIKKQENLM